MREAGKEYYTNNHNGVGSISLLLLAKPPDWAGLALSSYHHFFHALSPSSHHFIPLPYHPIPSPRRYGERSFRTGHKRSWAHITPTGWPSYSFLVSQPQHRPLATLWLQPYAARLPGRSHRQSCSNLQPHHNTVWEYEPSAAENRPLISRCWSHLLLSSLLPSC